MKRLLANERGLTLVEVLAGLVIAAILMIMITNIILLVQNQYKVQSADASGLFDITIAVKEITKEIRQNPSNIHIPDENTILFNESEENQVKYQFVDEALKKNERNFVIDIRDFYVEKVSASNSEKVILRIESSVDSNKNIDTEIIIR